MGEKLLAQRALALLRDTVGAQSLEGQAALGWATDQRDWLWPNRAWAGEASPGMFGRACGETLDWAALPRLISAIDTGAPQSPLFAGLDAAAALLELDPFDRALLETVAAFERLPRLAALRFRLGSAGADVPAFL